MTLYRFINIKKTIDILENMRLNLSNPLYFNDPFDCSLAVDDCDDEYISKYKEYGNMPIPCGNMVFRNPYANEINAYTNLINKAVTGEDIGEKNKWRICCFSQQENWPEHILMWSLYANEHKGCMIEFTDDFEEYLKKYKLKSVQYTNKRVHLNFSDTDAIKSKKAYQVLYHKSKAWKYEKEIRLLIPIEKFNAQNKELLQIQQPDGTTREFFKIKLEWIKKVYMGAKILNTDKQHIEALANKLNIQNESVRLCAVNYEIHSVSQPHI